MSGAPIRLRKYLSPADAPPAWPDGIRLAPISAVDPAALHVLLTAWAQNAEYELRILGRAMQSLEEHPSLSGPLLVEDAEWATGDSVQIVMEEITTEAVMRTYDSLPHDYKLSIPYVARVVRLDGAILPSQEVATRVLGMRGPTG